MTGENFFYIVPFGLEHTLAFKSYHFNAFYNLQIPQGRGILVLPAWAHKSETQLLVTR